MAKTQATSNFLKHTSKNPIQKLLITNFYKSFIGLAKSVNPTSVLDVGCGEGFSLAKLSVYKIGTKLEGVDDSKIALSLGKKLFPSLHLKYGNIHSLPYGNNSFDLVVCTEVLEHLKNPNNAIIEALRVSKKHVIFSVPNEPFFMLCNFLRGKNLWKWGNDPGHINHWTVFSFHVLLKKENIKIKAIKFPFPWIMALVEK